MSVFGSKLDLCVSETMKREC